MTKRSKACTDTYSDRKTSVRLSGGLRPQLGFVMICVVIAEAATGIQTEPLRNEAVPVPQLKEVATHINAAKKALDNLQVRSELWVDEHRNPNAPSQAWQHTPVYVSSTMWSDGQPGGKIRVDVHKQILKWLKNEEPVVSYSERSFSQSFDGAKGRTIIKRSGALGKAVARNGIMTSPKRPENLDDLWCRQYTGRYFTMGFFRLNEQGTLLSELFSLVADPNSLVTDYFDFTWERLGGIESIKISFKESRTENWSKRWWLDPARGFALLRYEHVRILEDKTQTYRVLMEIQELKRVAEGLWWPIKATSIVEPLRQGEPYTRLRYHASKVTANDPSFDEGVFGKLD